MVLDESKSNEEKVSDDVVKNCNLSYNDKGLSTSMEVVCSDLVGRNFF